MAVRRGANALPRALRRTAPAGDSGSRGGDLRPARTLTLSVDNLPVLPHK